MSAENTDIVRIGAGSFATGFVWQSHNNVVIKVVCDTSLAQDLRKEYDDLHVLYPIIASTSDCLFKVPVPIQHFPSFAKFKEDMGITQEELEQSFDRCALYMMERVWPVPPPIARSIRQRFFPEGHKDNVQPFVSRIYLGKELKAQSRFFNPLNFPLDAARLEALNIGVDTHQIANQMGRCLASIHFKARRDARDVEFVLGGKDLQTPVFFCIDFNQMCPWKSLSELVSSFFTNDPYYPRPGTEYWESFKEGYLIGAGEELKDATKVLDLIIAGADRASRQSQCPGVTN